MTDKLYVVMYRSGTRQGRYALSFHDGVKTHKDGSPFYDLRFFSNKKKLDAKIKEMRQEGYRSILCH